MTAVREQVTAAIVAALEAALPGVTVERSPDREFNRDTETPAIGIHAGGHPADNDTLGVSKYAMQLRVSGAEKGDTSVLAEQAANELYSSIVQALDNAGTFDGLIQDIRETNLEIMTDQAEGQGPFVTFDIEFAVEFWTRQGNPSQSF